MFPHEKTLFEQILLKDVWVEFRLYSDWCVPSSPWFGNHQCTTLTLWKCLSNFSKHYIRFLSFSDINMSEHLWPIQFLAFRTNQDIVGTVEGSCDHISWYFFNYIFVWRMWYVRLTSSLQDTVASPWAFLALQEYTPPSKQDGLRISSEQMPWVVILRNLGSLPMIIWFFIHSISGWEEEEERIQSHWETSLYLIDTFPSFVMVPKISRTSSHDVLKLVVGNVGPPLWSFNFKRLYKNSHDFRTFCNGCDMTQGGRSILVDTGFTYFWHISIYEFVQDARNSNSNVVNLNGISKGDWWRYALYWVTFYYIWHSVFPVLHETSKSILVLTWLRHNRDFILFQRHTHHLSRLDIQFAVN